MIRNKAQLGEYCLRKLGSPVINIEVAPEQIEDSINDTLQKYVNRHYDGTTETIFKHTVTLRDIENGYLTLPQEIASVLAILKETVSQSNKFENVEYHLAKDIILRQGATVGTLSNYFINMRHLTLVNRLLTRDNAFEYNTSTNRLYLRYPIRNFSTGNLLKTPNDISQSDWTAINSTLTGNDTVVIADDDVLADTVTSLTGDVFGVEQEIETEVYVRGVYTSNVYLKAGSYTGQVDFELKNGNGDVVASERIDLPTLWESFTISDFFDTDSPEDMTFSIRTVSTAAGPGETFHMVSPSVQKNNIIVIHGYCDIDPYDFENVMNDEWVKKYAVQKVKQQWGTNIKKYQGVQLPGGIEMNGQQIYDEATQELEKLNEEFSLTHELPVDFFIE